MRDSSAAIRSIDDALYIAEYLYPSSKGLLRIHSQMDKVERMKGVVIAKDWFYQSKESKIKLLAQLREIILELRQLKPPEATKIGSVDEVPLWDERIPRVPRNNSVPTPVAGIYSW